MKTELTWDDLIFKSQKMLPFGDWNTYAVPKDKMPETGEAYVMHRKNYSSQPETIKRLDDGSGELSVFDSRGD